MARTTHLGVVVTNAHNGVAFARICAVLEPAAVLRKIRQWCPLPAKFGMLVRAKDANEAYVELHRYLREQNGVHPMQSWSAWFVYSDVFADTVTFWCKEAVARGLIEHDPEVECWLGVEPTPGRTLPATVRRRRSVPANG